MSEDKSYADSIRDYLNSAGKTAETGEARRVLLKGKYKEFPVFRFPTKLLKFNLENTRFEVQKLVYEKKYGPIDQDKREGKEAIIKLLLYEENGVTLTKDGKTLKTDIGKNGQLDPGVITCDGYVINGNRRLACLIRLYDDNPEPKYEFFDGVRLPEGTDEKDYFKIEADLQWSKDLKVEYDPLNKYMMFKHALDFKMTPKEIAHLTRQTEKKTNEELAILTLIEDYLKTTKDRKDFSQVETQTEVFTEAAKQVIAYERSREKPSKIAAYKKLIFTLVNINRQKMKTVTYRDIRKLNKAFKKEDKRSMTVYQKIREGDDPSLVKRMLTEGMVRFQEHVIKEKPDKLSEDLIDTARKVYRESRMQQLSKRAEQLIQETISILKKTLS